MAGAAGVTPAIAGTNCGLDATFGRMLPGLPTASFAFPDLQKLAEAAVETTHFQPVGKAMSDEMHKFPAGYTYAGQFIDHDIVLDPRPNDLLTPVDPTAIANSRTPQFDLDSVYGAGPTGSPTMYEADGVHFLLGAPLSGAVADPDARDVLRGANGRAILGDDRNDENRIVGSLHSIFTRFHNHVADQVQTDHPEWSPAQVFAEARQQVTWHYQWAVLTDFLPRMSGDKETASVVARTKTGWATNLAFYNSCNGSIPVEFSVAAYRFGHSMVRNDYTLNDSVTDLPVFTRSGIPTESLVGFQPAPANFATDWTYFFDMTKTNKPQSAYQMDNSLVPALRLIPGRAAGTASTILSTRNLLRGQQLGLPSGQDVARAMGVTPLRDDQIAVGPVLGNGNTGSKPITAVSPAFAGKAPLWTYILAEASATNFTIKNGAGTTPPGKVAHLGPVGGRIVNETIVGLMLADPNSVLNHPEFTPDARLGSAKKAMLFEDIVRIGTDFKA
jgi:Animal haem peroxidase